MIGQLFCDLWGSGGLNNQVCVARVADSPPPKRLFLFTEMKKGENGSLHEIRVLIKLDVWTW